MKKISHAQLIDESTNGLNFLSQKLATKEYNGGIIGPAASSLFLTVLLVHGKYKKHPPSENHLLKDYYNKYSSKSDLNDFQLIGCMRHALAHNDFSFELSHLEFKTEKYGTLQIPYPEFTSLTNKIFSIFNNLKFEKSSPTKT